MRAPDFSDQQLVADLSAAVTRQDGVRLTKVPGIGKKTAERLLLELKGKLGPDMRAPGATVASDAQADIVQALMALGYNEKEAAAKTGGRLPRWAWRPDDTKENKAANLAEGDARLRMIVEAAGGGAQGLDPAVLDLRQAGERAGAAGAQGDPAVAPPGGRPLPRRRGIRPCPGRHRPRPCPRVHRWRRTSRSPRRTVSGR